MSKESISISLANRLINAGPVVLVSTFDGKKPNVLTVAWNMPVNHDPMEVAVSIGKSNYSNDAIKRTGEFVVNVPTVELLEKVIACGKVSGRECNKFETIGLTAVNSEKLKSPRIKECVGHIECKVVDTIQREDHSIFIGRVVAASINKGTFDQFWKMEKGLIFVHHLGGKVFTCSEGIL